MAAELASLVLKMSADSAQLRTDIKRVQSDMTGLRKSATNLERGFQGLSRTLAGVFAAVGVTRGLRAILQATTQQEAALRQVEQRIKTTGGAAQRTADDLSAMSSSLQSATTFADEQILAMQSVLLTFTRIAGAEFDAATEAVLDMATAMGQDLTSTAVQVGKALNDPIQGATALRRVGVQLTDSQKQLIKSLVETGRQAEAQRVILAELTTEFGGSARAARDTFGGALQGLKNAFGDLLEAHQGLPGARVEIEKLTAALSDPKLQADMDRLVSGLVSGFAELAGNLPEVVAHLEKVAKLMTAIGAALAGASIGRMFGLTGALVGGAVGGLGAAGALFGGDVGRALPGGQLIEDALARGKAQEDQLRALGESLRGAGMTAIRIAEPGAGGALPSAAAPDTTAAAAANDAAEKRAESIAKIIASLREEAETYGLTAEQIALYKLAQLGASDAQLAMASALTAKLDLMRDEDAAMEASRQVADEWAEATHQARLADQQLIETLADEIRLMELGSRERAQEEAVRRLSAEATDEQREAVRRLAGELFDQREAAQDAAASMDEFARQAARDLKNTLGDELFNILQGNFDDIAGSFKRMLDRMVADALAAQLGKAIMEGLSGGGGLVGSAISAVTGAFGGGGGGGNAASPGATGLDASIGEFITAGLASGGPASPGKLYLVGEKGPELFSPESSGRVIPNDELGGGDTIVQIIDQRGSGERPEVQQTQGPDGRQMIRVLIRDEVKAAIGSGSLDRTMAGVFGVRRRSS